MNWYYISFVDKTFLGACLVRAASEREALIEAKNQGCNPGGEAAVVFVEPEHGEPPKDLQNVLFTNRNELEEKFATWLGPEGAKTETAKERIERRGSLGGTFVCQDCNDELPPSYD